jgi:hypothetical protein
MEKQQKYFANYANRIGAKILQVNDIVKAHLAPQKIRTNCCVSTDVGAVILSSSRWNQIEETTTLLSRNLIYGPAFSGVLFEEIMQNMHDQTRQEIIAKLDRLSNLSSDELFLNEMSIEGHKEMSYVSTKQLSLYYKSLNVKSEEGIFVFLTRDTMSKMKELYVDLSSPVQAAMFHIPGDGKQHVKPGVLLDKSMQKLDTYYLIGMGVCENISTPLAKTMLQKELAALHYQGYATVTQASQRFANLEEQQKRGEVAGLPSFQSLSATGSLKPGTPEFEKYLKQKELKGLNQTPLAKDAALEMSQVNKIGDCNKSFKHKLRCVGDRSQDELFQNNFTESRSQSAKPNALKSHPISINNSDD